MSDRKPLSLYDLFRLRSEVVWSDGERACVITNLHRDHGRSSCDPQIITMTLTPLPPVPNRPHPKAPQGMSPDEFRAEWLNVALRLWGTERTEYAHLAHLKGKDAAALAFAELVDSFIEGACQYQSRRK